VFFENDLGDALFMILSGRVKVTILSDDGREVILSMLSEHDCFGEMSLLDDQPRSATVIALSETDILEYSGQAGRQKSWTSMFTYRRAAFAILSACFPGRGRPS